MLCLSRMIVQDESTVPNITIQLQNVVATVNLCTDVELVSLM